MPKRKAVSSPEKEEETAPKKNRLKRAEAKARAREWAEKNAAGLNKTKSPAPPPRRRGTPIKKATPTRRSTAARRSTPKKESPIESPEPAKKRQKLNSGKKLTKKEQIAEAKARAQEWAEKELHEKKKTTSKSSIASPKKSPAVKSPAKKQASAKKPSPPVDDASPEPLPPPRPYSNALYGTNVTGDPNGYYADMLRAQQQQRQIMELARRENAQWQLAQQQQPTMPLSPDQHRLVHHQIMQNAAMAAYGQPWPHGYAPPVAAVAPGQSPPPAIRHAATTSTSTYLRSPPPTKTSAPTAAKAPTPARATRRSTTTKAKKKETPVASASPPKVAPFPIPPEETDHVPVEQDDVEAEDNKTGFRFSSISISRVLLPIIGAFLAYLAFRFTNSGSEALGTVKQSEPVLPRCFISNPREESQVFENCNNSERALRCPEGGRCSQGQLVSCVKPYMAVSESGEQCVLSAATNETLAEVEALLAEWTIEQTCSLTGAAHPINSPSTRAPFFNIERIKEKVDIDESLLSLSDSFVVLSGNDETIVGFTEEYIDTKLIVPFWCYCGLLLFSATEMLLGLILYVGSSVTEVALKLTKSFPLAALALVVILSTLYVIRKKRRERAKVRHDVATVRELTYGMLVVDVKMEHLVIHLRDAVALDLYPVSKSKRAYIVDRVWPRVVAEVKQDNRVRKSKTMHLGHPCDTWQWTAAKPTPSKK